MGYSPRVAESDMTEKLHLVCGNHSIICMCNRLTQCSVLSDNQEGWDRVGGKIKRTETYVYLWLIYVYIGEEINTIL